MTKKKYTILTCANHTFCPVISSATRWWASEDWREYYNATYGALGWGNSPLPKKDWIKLYKQGCRYCATLRRGRALAVAGLWPRSKEAWEVIAVGVRAGQMRKGHAKAIVSFVADEILKTGRKATISAARFTPLDAR